MSSRTTSAGSMLIRALERTWAGIRRRHADVPQVVIITGAGSGRHPGALVLGHFAAHRWDVNGQGRHELFVGGEGLARGAREVLATLLHEATHGLAAARGIKDTSRQGRYHNTRYRQLAQELGIEVIRHAIYGWSPTTLPEATAETYAAELEALERALVLVRRSERGVPVPTGDEPGSGDTVKTPTPTADTPAPKRTPVYICQCEEPRRLRMARAAFQAGPITCGICDAEFALKSEPEPEDEGTDEPEVRTAGDQGFPAAA